MRQPIEDRYWAKVDRTSTPDGCWPWVGAHSASGHGQFWDGTRHPSGNPRLAYAHRWAHMRFVGPVTDEQRVLHSCDNPPCQNPAHWFLGTQGDNIQDMVAKGRGRYPGRRGERHHAARLTIEQVREIRTRRTGRRGEITALAAEYGMSRQQIGAILAGTFWRETA